jgi:hypothetical protein
MDNVILNENETSMKILKLGDEVEKNLDHFEEVFLVLVKIAEIFEVLLDMSNFDKFANGKA